MANQYFIFKSLPEVGEQFTIDNEAVVHHIFNVMRTQDKEELRLVFADTKLGLVKVVNAALHQVELIEVLEDKSELPVNVTIAVGFPKGDKLDFIAEKVTELGAKSIIAAPFKWSVAKWDKKKLAKKQEKLSKIVLGAAEQSRRLQVPEITLYEQFIDFQESLQHFDHVLVAYEESAKAGESSAYVQALRQMTSGQKICIIFGPEGGIAAEEIEKFEAAGAKMIGLGPRIMRAETAPLYALSAVSTYFELLGDEAATKKE